jgi:hypothetical protein
MPICARCGWWDRFCHCSSVSLNIIDHSWVSRDTWEHIDPKLPRMKIESKKQLIHECEKRGLLCKAFMKPRSQGKGFEHAK